MSECVNCGKSPAQLYRRVVEGTEKTVCLCSACFEKLYAEKDTDVLTQFLGNTGGKRSKTCPNCGTSLEDFRKTGLLGCAECYQAFRTELIPTVRYCQRDVTHRGKTPSADAVEKYDFVRELVREQDAVKAEIDHALLSGNYRLAREKEAELKEIKEKLARAGEE